MTVDEYAQRHVDLLKQATAFNQRLLQNIKVAAQDPASSQDSEDAVGLNDDENAIDLGNHAFPEIEKNLQPEDDVDDQLDDVNDGEAGRSDGPVQVPEEQLLSKDMADYVALLDAQPYDTAVRQMMHLLMDNGLSEYSIKKDTECPLCLDDDTIRVEDDKFKIWEPYKLSRHMNAQIHSPFKVMLREARNLMNDQGKDEMECRFCAAIVPTNHKVPSFSKEGELARHIK